MPKKKISSIHEQEVLDFIKYPDCGYRRIKWCKWRDPLKHDDEIISDKNDKNDDDINSDILNDDSDIKTLSSQSKPAKHDIIFSPIIGCVPMNEFNLPSENFNFWLGHTNFNLGKTSMEIINSIIAVETLDIITRYRFRVSFGQCFDKRYNMQRIERAVCLPDWCYEEKLPAGQVNRSTQIEIRQHANELEQKYPYWCIYINPKGKFISIHDLNFYPNQFYIPVYDMLQKCKMDGGDILKSWECGSA